jgi:cytochrome c biogenesis protein CcmG/thiol:disulfide interchange protein DsbE
MKHPTRWIAGGVALVVVSFAVVLATQVGDDPRADANTSHLSGKAVPRFSVEALDGQTVTDRSLAGKAVVVNFWNTWCIPCRQEHPALQAFYRRHSSDTDFALLGIVRDDTTAAARKWVRAQGDAWTVAIDPNGRASVAFGTRGQPETYAISADGFVVGYQFGPTSVQDLEALLNAARAGGP